MRTYAERTISLPARSTRTSLPDLIILLRVSFWFTVIRTKGSQRNNNRGREGGRVEAERQKVWESERREGRVANTVTDKRGVEGWNKWLPFFTIWLLCPSQTTHSQKLSSLSLSSSRPQSVPPSLSFAFSYFLSLCLYSPSLSRSVVISLTPFRCNSSEPEGHTKQYHQVW